MRLFAFLAVDTNLRARLDAWIANSSNDGRDNGDVLAEALRCRSNDTLVSRADLEMACCVRISPVHHLEYCQIHRPPRLRAEVAAKDAELDELISSRADELAAAERRAADAASEAAAALAASQADASAAAEDVAAALATSKTEAAAVAEAVAAALAASQAEASAAAAA